MQKSVSFKVFHPLSKLDAVIGTSPVSVSRKYHNKGSLILEYFFGIIFADIFENGNEVIFFEFVGESECNFFGGIGRCAVVNRDEGSDFDEFWGVFFRLHGGCLYEKFDCIKN